MNEVDLVAAEQAVRELFGWCSNVQMAPWTMDLYNCGECAGCKRDWMPEAKAIVSAAIGPVE
jgi:hypothetical protein